MSAESVVQRCMACGAVFGDLDPRIQCGSCGGLLDIEHPAPAEKGPALRARFDQRTGTARGFLASGVWRFREIVHPSAGDDVVSWPEGNTPLLSREAVSSWTGCPGLLLKHEGYNPTGSFKDRGMTVAVTQARRIGATAVACATTGNTGASLAAYASAAGLTGVVIVPGGGVALGKLAQVMAYGARTLVVRGDFDACLRLAREATEELGFYLVNSINPFRLEGQKTIVLELLQQVEWNPPDWIVVPAGNLGNTAAFGKALAEARACGLISRLPRLAAVQAEGAAPFARSFQDGFKTRHSVVANTVASAIRIGDPASWDRAVRAIRETNGVVTTVSDSEILEAKAVVDASGVGCEPASAAAVAGARRLVRDGVIGPGQSVAAVLTGHLLKDPGVVTWYHSEVEPRPPLANRPVEIDARISDVARALRSR